MLAELKPSGIINIDCNLLPRGYRVKQILSSTLESSYNFLDLTKRKSFLLTLLIESNDKQLDQNEDCSVLSIDLNPYI